MTYTKEQYLFAFGYIHNEVWVLDVLLLAIPEIRAVTGVLTPLINLSFPVLIIFLL